MPFASATMRTFGHWLAAIEERTLTTITQTRAQTTINRAKLGALDESPGAAKRLSEEIAPEYRGQKGTTVDELFQMAQIRGTVFPGELLIYNLDTDVRLRISTGSGDSEVIFVSDDAVYIGSTTRYRRGIAGATLGDAVKLAEGPEIVQVHWAFIK